MKRPVCIAIALTLLALSGLAPEGRAADETQWTLKKALKQMDKVVKAHIGVSGTIEYEELYRSRTVGGSGTIHVRFDGRIRAEIGGNSPRTFLVRPPYLQIYRPVDESVEVLTLGANPDMLAQYALLGFTPAGSDLKKAYDLILTEQTVVDGRDMLILDLTPKSKATAKVITKIRVWVDIGNWLPAGLLVFHKPSGIQVSVRYSDVTPQDALPDTLFKSDWPEETRMIRR